MLEGRLIGGPKEGLVVTIYMIGEVEMEATLQWDARWKCWVGQTVEGTTIRENHDTWD